MGLTTSKISNLPGQKSEGGGGGGEFSPFETSIISRSNSDDACEDNNNGQFYIQANPPAPTTPTVGSTVYTNAAGTAFPAPGFYSQFLDQYGVKVWYELDTNGYCRDAGSC